MSTPTVFVWRSVAAAALVAAAVSLAVAIGLGVNQRSSSHDGCERGKADRAMIAQALRAQSDYLNLVLDARSVKQDVKRAARVNQRVQDASAADLESRTGRNLDCDDIYPPFP